MRDARRTGGTSCPPGTQIALPQPPVLPRRPREASASFPRLTPPRSNSGIAVAFEGRFGRPPYNALVLARHCWPGVQSEAPRSTALWAPASAFHRLPAPASCARPVPATPRLRPMDAERSGRPGEYPRTDSELQKTQSGRPSPRCERRSCDRSCAQSLAWGAPASQASVSRSEEAHSRLEPETHGICSVPRR